MFRNPIPKALALLAVCGVVHPLAAQDAFLTNAFVPLFVKANTNRTISVRVRNAATTPLITFRVDWRWNSGPVQQGFSQTTTGISGNQFWPYDHPVPFNIPQGGGVLKVWVVGNGETNRTNDTLTFPVTALDQWHSKTMLLDVWTGTWCPQCPPANLAGNTLDADPFVVVAKHHAVDQFSSGSSADYYAPYNVNFTPAGVIDQGEYGRYTPNPATTSWPGEMELRKQGVSPVSLSMSTDFNALTRMLTVNLSAAYTYPLPGTHALNAFVLEDGIVAPQANASSPYTHNQIVRNVLSGTLGNTTAVPGTPAPGTTYSTTWNYIVPEDWEARNIRVVGLATHRVATGSYLLNALAAAPLTVGVQEVHTPLAGLRTWPNPAHDALWVQADDAIGELLLRVFSADGRMVLEQRAFAAGGPLRLEGFDRLAPGPYVLRVQHGDAVVDRRVVKE